MWNCLVEYLSEILWERESINEESWNVGKLDENIDYDYLFSFSVCMISTSKRATAKSGDKN